MTTLYVDKTCTVNIPYKYSMEQKLDKKEKNSWWLLDLFYFLSFKWVFPPLG